jgi:predicted methyltransferase
MKMTRLASLAMILALITGATHAAAPGADSAAPAEHYVIPAGTPAYIARAVESSARDPAAKARDAVRKPAELLTLSGVKPGQRILELASFGQYFTAMLSDIAGPTGKVYMLDLPYTEKRAGAASRAFVAAHPNCEYTLADYNTAELPANVDIVFNVLYYHDLYVNDIDTASFNARIFKALKPGGIFLVVDHNAQSGSGTRDAKTLHRIDPEIIRKEVTAAGFELVQESKLLARDSDDHTKMVFTPGLRGLTDQSVFKFRKPLR